MYKAQICHSSPAGNDVKEITYISLSEEFAVKDAITFANSYTKELSEDTVITRVKVFEYKPSTITPAGKLIEHKGKLLFSWDHKNARIIKDYLKNLRNKPDVPPDIPPEYDA